VRSFANRAVIALDLGTSSLKALAVSSEGRLLGQAKRAYATHHPYPGWNEQDPNDWWLAAAETTRELTSLLPDTTFAAIGLTGQMHGTVVLDANGEAQTHAVIWSDRRAVAERNAIASEIGPDLASMIGGPLGAGYQAPTVRWFASHRPELLRPECSVFLPKDALAFHLTGVRAAEPSDAVSTGMMDARSETWEATMLRAAGINERQLPAIVPSGTIIGGLRTAIALQVGLDAGIPIVIAGGDAPCGAIGAGVTSPEQAMLMLSSGAQVILPTLDDTPDPAGRWHTFPSAVGIDQAGCRRNRVGATSNAGIAFEWFARLSQTDVPACFALAANVPAGARGALFIPSLTGQRTPVLDPGARGTFYGLMEQHGIPELARAVIEGVVFACRHVFATMVSDHERRAKLLLGGGPSQHAVVRQIVADIFGLLVQPLESADLSALGAARIAMHALGWPEDIVDSDTTGAIMPDSSNNEIYDTLFTIHVDAAETSRDISHRLDFDSAKLAHQ